MITQKELKEKISYDQSTGEFSWLVGRFVNVVCGYINQDGYRKISINKREYCAHRLAWLYVYGEWPKDQIDHINNDPSDNRICNLREATFNQNMQNRRIKKNHPTGYKGVGFNKRLQKYIARIVINGKQKTIGFFNDPQLAHDAYVSFAKEIHKEFFNKGY